MLRVILISMRVYYHIILKNITVPHGESYIYELQCLVLRGGQAVGKLLKIFLTGDSVLQKVHVSYDLRRKDINLYYILIRSVLYK